jgi:hypothetical protein
MAGLAVAALLVGGGVALGANLRAGNANTQAVALVNSSAIRSAVLGGHDHAGLRARGLLLVRRLMLVGAEHGQITFRTRKGSRTVAFERGVIQTASLSSVVVKAADGITLTWHLVSKTAVVRVRDRVGDRNRTRIRGKNRTIDRVSALALAAGQRVFVVGAVVGGTDAARLIIIRG